MTDNGEVIDRAAVAETHISTVFFAGDRAYKLLKPVRTTFLDQSTTARRLEAVDNELILNRRLAPDVYLGTADVVEEGRVVDRLLVMRRLPDNLRLARVAAEGRTQELERALRLVARRIAAFHSAQEPAPDAEAIAGPDAVAANWADNFAVLDPGRGSPIETEAHESVRHLAERFVAHRRALFERRITDGFVRDGHGDLTAQDIFCLDDGPRILDCLAFDRRLRVADVLADVAFLAMDLERLAGTRPAAAFLGWYAQFSNEHHPPALLHHYLAYRAHVRAKVAAIRHGQGDPESAALARRYHDLCHRHLTRGVVRLILVGGTPGTGKTTLSAALAEALSAATVGTDELRKDLAGRGHLEHATDPPDQGLYRPEMSRRTYDELLRRAGLLLARGESVILDASWAREADRARARRLAHDQGATVDEFRCVLDADASKARIAARLEAGTDASDARPDLVDELRRRFEPWPAAVEVDTARPMGDVVAGALAATRPEVHVVKSAPVAVVGQSMDR